MTHAFNQSQYINELSFSQTTGGLNVTAPPNGNVAPPGYYLLFLLNGSGVPSVANSSGSAARQPPTRPRRRFQSPLRPAAPPSRVPRSRSPATASDNVGVAGVQFKLDGANLGAEDTASPYSVAWNSTTATNGSHTLTAVARDAAGNMTISVGVSVTVNNTASDYGPLTCRGRVANISVFNNTIFGGPDSGTPYTGTLRGTNGNDVIVGTDANDSINGAGGNDIICGGAGRDTLRGATRPRPTIRGAR